MPQQPHKLNLPSAAHTRRSAHSAGEVKGREGETGEDTRTMRSSNLRDARRAGEKTTHSQPMVSARQATKMAMLNVLPKRRGVEMSTSPGVVFQPCAFIILGRCVPHESR